MPPNTLHPGQKSHPDMHNGHLMAIGASLRIGLRCAVGLSRSLIAYSWQVLLISIVTAATAMAQEDGRLQPDNVFSELIDSNKRHTLRQHEDSHEDSSATESRLLRANWSSDSQTRRLEIGEKQSSRPSSDRMQRVAEIADTDPSPLARETARLQLIEWKYSGDFTDALKAESSNRIRQIGFTPGVESSDFDFSRIDDAKTKLIDPFAGSEESPVWSQAPEKLPAEKEQAFRLINAEFQDDQPDVLRSPFPPIISDDEFTPQPPGPPGMTRTVFEAPLGFTGPSSVLPSEVQQSEHFVPIEDRWRIGFPEWDRYGKGNPDVDDQPYETGHWWDPYNQNVLKGDYPIIGQHTFLNITATNELLNEFREVPTGTTPFESTVNPNQQEFFGNPKQYFLNNNLRLNFNLSHGDAGFKPVDWQVRMTPVFNLNYLNVKELGVVNPDVRQGTTRFRTDVAFEEWFAEAKLADLSPNYDFMSVRAGSQPFVSDFRGFIFSDTNRAVRLFGTRLANRDQFNLIFFDQTEKETNSLLNTFDDRNQNTLIANYFRQDFIVPGFTTQFSFHYNNDGPSTEFDRNNFLVRPDPVGVFRPHRVEAYYFGVAGDGHIGRVNVNHAFYHVEGTDSMNPIQGQKSYCNSCNRVSFTGTASAPCGYNSAETTGFFKSSHFPSLSILTVLVVFLISLQLTVRGSLLPCVAKGTDSF